LALQGWHEEISILRTQNSRVSWEIHLRLGLSARCTWSDKTFIFVRKVHEIILLKNFKSPTYTSGALTRSCTEFAPLCCTLYCNTGQGLINRYAQIYSYILVCTFTLRTVILSLNSLFLTSSLRQMKTRPYSLNIGSYGLNFCCRQEKF